MSIPIVSGFHISSPGHIDDRYSDNGLPYSTTSSAIAAIPNYRYIGLTVLVGSTSSTPYPQEYWWQNGTSDSQLVLKQPVGNIIGSASNGYITVWSGTTSITYTPNLYYNSNGLLIGTNSSYGSYSLQVSGQSVFISNTYSAIHLQSLSGSTVGIDSNTYASAFSFYNLKNASTLQGSNTYLLNIVNSSDTPSGYNANLLLMTSPYTGNGGSGSLALLKFCSAPNASAPPMSIGASLDQVYTYANTTQYSTNYPYSYIDIGLFGVIMLDNTYRAENSAFRWETINNGSIYETMRLSGNNLLIGYTQSQGTYSLQVNGSSLINGNSSTNSYMIYGNSSALVLSGNSNYGIYSHSVNAGFSFFNQSHSNILSGSSNAILDIQQISNTAGPYGLLIRTVPSNMTNGGTGSFNLLNFLSSPGTASNQGLAVNAILNQTYTMYDPIIGSYSSMGDFGSVMLNNTYGSVSSAFRWTTSNNGIVYENMRLQGFGGFGNSQLLIGYTQSQGTYSLQVNGNAYVYGNISASGSITAQTGGFDSDIRLKSDIVYNPIIKGIDTIRSASYIIGNKKHIGYIAQEVENIIPSSIIKKEDGYLALNYNEVLVAKISYLEDKIKQFLDIIERNGLK